jgi:hypothetical protein
MKIFAAALQYSPGKRLDGSPCTYVRFRVIVEGAADLWTDEDLSALEANEIATRSIKEVDGIQLVRIDAAATDLSSFVEWTPSADGSPSELSTGSPSADPESLTLRTFLNVLGPDGKSLFGQDDCWNTIRIGDKPLNYWFHQLSVSPIIGLTK